MKADQEMQDRLERVESLIQQADELADPAARQNMQEIVQGLLDYHGAAVSRMLELIDRTGSRDTVKVLAADELVSSLLLLYDLHPVDLRSRVEQALVAVRPLLKSHGGEVELLDVEGGVVRLRMQGNCHGCPSSRVTLKTTIEEAIYRLAPDVVGIDVDGLAEESQLPTTAGFVPLATLAAANGG